MYTIVGAGFGLYGYLPALVEGLGEPVVLPCEYRAEVEARPELRNCLSNIEWTESTASAIARSDAVIVAVPPRLQPSIVRACLRAGRPKRLVLEKPLAATPSSAIELLAELRSSKLQFRIGYNLRFTAWFADLQRAMASVNEQLALAWRFMAHHFQHELSNWKRRESEGGGVLRFYGIHLIALLAELGYREIGSSRILGGQDEPERWCAQLIGHNLPPCRIEVDSKSRTRVFTITVEKADRREQEDEVVGGQAPVEPEQTIRSKPSLIVDLQDPFDREMPDDLTLGHDRRVRVLTRLLRTFEDEDRRHVELYESVNMLWSLVEASSQRGPRPTSHIPAGDG